jgi:S-adenosyl methyltransferase
VYVDYDPVVVAHARTLLADTPAVAAVKADAWFPRDLLTLPAMRALIDFEEPVAVLLVAVLHFVPDYACPQLAVRCIIEHLAPGSYLVISHVTSDEVQAEAISRAREIYDSAFVRGTARSKDDIERFFDGLELAPPGVVDVTAWRSPRPTHTSRPALFYAGIGRKTGGTPPSPSRAARQRPGRADVLRRQPAISCEVARARQALRATPTRTQNLPGSPGTSAGESGRHCGM